MGALYVTVSTEQMHDEAFGVDVTSAFSRYVPNFDLP